jgi:hypothetical protein
MTISLVLWNEEKTEFVREQVEEVFAVSFTLKSGAVVEASLAEDDDAVTVRSTHGRLKITMDVANQFRLEVDRG